MDQSSTPWRALEDIPDIASASDDARAGGSGLRRAAIIAAGAGLLACAAFVLAFGTGTGGAVGIEGTTALGTATSTEPSAGLVDGYVNPAAETTRLIVEIVGAVDRPGVYRLPSGARIGDLVDAAGGYGPRVDIERAGRELNLAAPLHDGDQVRVPSRDDPAIVAPPPTAGGRGAGGSAPVDLNHASATDLDALPGIGPVTATKIIAAREERPFASIDELRSRKLVGEKTFANLKDLVTVR